MKHIRSYLQLLLCDGIICLVYWVIPYVFDLGCTAAEFYHKYMDIPIGAALAAIVFSIAALIRLRKISNLPAETDNV